jgi:hypothetical protein
MRGPPHKTPEDDLKKRGRVRLWPDPLQEKRGQVLT